MPSFKVALVAVTTLLASAVRADYYIDPDSVSLAIRTSWCQTEKSTCPLICDQYKPGTTLTNTCDPKTLQYGCLCGNNLQPNISEYSLTLPYFTCTEWGNQCVAACGSDNACSSSCRQDHPCGAQNPTKVNATTSSTAAATGTGAAGASNTVIYNGASGAQSAGNAAPAGLEAGSFVGFFSLAAGLIAGFGYLL